MPSVGVQTCALDRKSTRLNSSHTIISYAVFCLKKIRSDRKSTRLNSSHTIIKYAVFCLKKKNRQREVELGAEEEARVLAFVVVALREPRHALGRAFFFFNDTAPTEIYPLPLPDALPI